MDTRQWIEPPDASASLPPPWAPPSSNGCNVFFPWYEYNSFYPQPHTQISTPDSIGAPWPFGVQNQFNQSTGVITTPPPTSHLDYNEHRNVIASLIPTFDARQSSSHPVPQRRYTNNRRNRSVRGFKPEQSICFDTYSGLGFPMKDALDRNFKSLVGREDPMLPHVTAISLRFEFEGYESWTCQVKTRDSRKTPHPIPREKLAHEVAKKLVAFLNKRQVKLGETDFLSRDEISLNSVNAKEFVLLRLDHVSKSSWQPQFVIVRNA